MPPGVGYPKGRGKAKPKPKPKPKSGVNPGVRGSATPNARAGLRANSNASFKRSDSGFDLGRFLANVGSTVDRAAKSVFPAGRGNAISDSMKAGADKNNPLKRILGGK
ncbi:MAG TPA: hypothetical protein VM285_07175 [Polyangia bacterium]|nr:hypothetical protein [Polyangia bacterium]HUW17352.1 hypothetical protein [Actinomycetes bacterium]